MVRVIFLLSADDKPYRQQLLNALVNGEKWTVKMKKATVTDRQMVDFAQSLQGWTQFVYKFGCDFIHLSNFHDNEHRDPLSTLSSDEKAAILSHMRDYHRGPASDDPSFEELSRFLPTVFEKVSSNLDCYLRQLEADESQVTGAI